MRCAGNLTRWFRVANGKPSSPDGAGTEAVGEVKAIAGNAAAEMRLPFAA